MIQSAAGPGLHFDLVVIGTGGGGTAAAIRAAELGRKVAVVEAGTIGGTCVNIGCIPSKALIRAARAYHTAGHHPFAGLRTHAEGVDWPALIAQKNELISSLRQHKYVDVLRSYAEIHLFQNRAHLTADADVRLDDGRVLRAEKVVIATGARPNILQLPGIEKVQVLTSTTLMDLPQQPRSLLVLGGRAIALELGQALARLGTKVTILQRSPRLLPDHDPDIGEGIRAALEAEGIEVVTGVQLQKISEAKGEKEVVAAVNGETRTFHAEHILMALGRIPNTEHLGLEDAGVETDSRGFIRIDEFLQTSNPKVYAAGDVTTLPKLVYVAAAAGGLAAANALSEERIPLDLSVLPEVVFTEPQVATVGLTEEAAREAGYEVKTSRLDLEHVPRALTERDTRGFIKLVADAATDQLLGAHILANEAGEILQSAAMAVEMGRKYGFTVGQWRNMFFPYLTQVEGLKLAAQTFEKDVAKLSCCAG